MIVSIAIISVAAIILGAIIVHYHLKLRLETDFGFLGAMLCLMFLTVLCISLAITLRKTQKPEQYEQVTETLYRLKQ